MKNKYAICFTLYNDQLSNTNLYYYKGIINSLCVENRNFDIYIDTTKFCKKILFDIIQQEELSTDNVYITTYDNNINIDIQNFITMFKHCNKYELIGIENSHNFSLYNYFIDYENNPKYSVYTICTTERFMNHPCVELKKNYSNFSTYICKKNFKTNFYKIIKCCNDIINSKYISKKYNLRKYLLDSLLILETLNNNNAYFTYYKNTVFNYAINTCNYISPNYKTYKLFKNIKTSKYFNLDEDVYYLNNSRKEYNNIKPYNNMVYTNTYNNIYINIQKYILDFINDLNLKDYDYE